jgi:enoyl-CoA hydratase/carnithine racemase
LIRLLGEGPAAVLELDRPARRNAIDRAMWRAIPDLAARAAADPAVRVLAIRSAVPGSFSAGADLDELLRAASDPGEARACREEIEAATAALAGCMKPVVALVEGACIGGGCGLALAADIILAGTGARFGITAARLGLVWPAGDMARLIARVGPGRAADLLFTGRILDARQAHAIGLADRLVEAEDFAAAAADLIGVIAENAPATLAAAKAAIAGAGHQEIAAAFEASVTSPEFRRRAAAALRRPPGSGAG